MLGLELDKDEDKYKKEDNHKTETKSKYKAGHDLTRQQIGTRLD